MPLISPPDAPDTPDRPQDRRVDSADRFPALDGDPDTGGLPAGTLQGAAPAAATAVHVLAAPEPEADDFALTEADGGAQPVYSLDGVAAALAGQAITLPDTAPLLPALREGVALSSGAINGMFQEDLFVGDGSSTFLVSLIDSLSFAVNRNTLGVYEVDAAGNIVDVRILVNDTKATPSAQEGIFGVEAGNELGFFLVSNGADWANGLGSGDTLSFIDGAGGTANLSDGSDLSLAVNGLAADVLVFHSLQSSLNVDGRTHVVSGSLAGDARIFIAFEDQRNGGDMDYQDVVFQVDDALLV